MRSIPAISSLIDRCHSLSSAESLHSHILKLGLLHRCTFLANRLLHLYSRLQSPTQTLTLLFQEIPTKNVFTHNILLSSFSASGQMDDARHLFSQIPQRDSVSWNSLISGYASLGLLTDAFSALYRMQELGFPPTHFTFSIVACKVFAPVQAKQVHGSATRNGFDSSNVVLANSFINMFGNVGLPEYAFKVLRSVKDPDVVSWNTMISVFGNSGEGIRGFECLREMRSCGFSLDEFAISAAIGICADVEDLTKGEQLFSSSVRMGFLSNSIVSSSVIDMYSKCGRLGDSVRLFQEMRWLDSALCNSMMSAYARYWLVGEALRLFVEAVRAGIRLTEFTFAIILSSSSCFGLAEQGTQIHCHVVKLGFEEDRIIASALVDMYMKLGIVGSAVRIFGEMVVTDLISCNTMIFGLGQNGQARTALRIFERMLMNGPQPDRITLVAVLSACSYEGMLNEGNDIFSSMEKYRIERNSEHYACMVDMMGRAGRLGEGLDIIMNMPRDSTALVWELLLEACIVHGDFRLTEVVAEEVMKLEPLSSLPYILLARIYGTKGRWESVARVWKTMNERGVKKVGGCCWIGIRSHVYSFKDGGILQFGGEGTYSMLRLVLHEMEREGYVQVEHAGSENG